MKTNHTINTTPKDDTITRSQIQVHILGNCFL